LLFANRSYRLWFGADARGHALLAGGEAAINALPDHEDAVDNFGGLPAQEITEAGSDPREVYIDTPQKWFDVRSRYLQWTDGRLAQMLIATDITSRKRADMLAAQQAEKAPRKTTSSPPSKKPPSRRSEPDRSFTASASS
jgi:hypothetical protein